MNYNNPVDQMVEDIKRREEWEKNRSFREGFQKVALAIGMILFFGWLLISLWLAFAGVKDNSCTSASGEAVYCGE